MRKIVFINLFDTSFTLACVLYVFLHLFPRKFVCFLMKLEFHSAKNKVTILVRMYLQKSVSEFQIYIEYYYFLLPISRESIIFGSNFRNGDFDGFTRFEVS